MKQGRKKPVKQGGKKTDKQMLESFRVAMARGKIVDWLSVPANKEFAMRLAEAVANKKARQSGKKPPLESFDPTIPVKRVKSIDELTKHQQGRSGLWAHKQGSSFFDNSRELYTLDPTEHEESLDSFHRALGQIREDNGKGRVVI